MRGSIRVRVEWTLNRNYLYADTPYNKDMIAGAKGIGGKWIERKEMWQFDPRDKDMLTELLRAVYGTDGEGEELLDRVTVRVSARAFSKGDMVVFAGRILVRRPMYKMRVILSDEVRVVSGLFPETGGNQQKALIGLGDGSDVQLEVRDFPRKALASVPDGSYTVVEKTDEPVDKDALRAERRELVKRVAQIDSLLGT